MVQKTKEKVYAFEGKKIIVTMNNTSFRVLLEKRKYQNGGIAINGICVGGEDDGDPFGTLSVNLPESRNMITDITKEVFIKVWSENEAFAEAARNSGFFVDTGKLARTGFVAAEVWELLTVEEWEKLQQLPYYFDKELYCFCPNEKALEQFAKEGGWDDLDDLCGTTGVTIQEFVGRWFLIVDGRVFIKEAPAPKELQST